MTRLIAKKFDKSNKIFLESVGAAYGQLDDELIPRLNMLLDSHLEKNPEENLRLFSSPGRIEIIGNHTDHNNGKVVAAAITIDNLAVVTPLSERLIVIKTVGYPDIRVSLDDITYKKEEEGTSDALLKGVLNGFLQRGFKVGGFYATTMSKVFKGAGISSSASFEVLITEILNTLYNDNKIDAVTRAVISQYAENKFFGKPSGLMDQAASSVGGISYIDFENANPIIKKLDWNFEGITAVVVNCGGDHSNLTPCYTAIKDEMEQISAYFGKGKLRFVEEAEFYKQMPKLKAKFSGRAIMRAIHFFEENKRVDLIAKAIKEGDLDKFLDLVNQSGLSSYCLLQNLYPEGDTLQNIPLALALTKNFKGVRAARVHGGGFAGTILVFVNDDCLDNYVEYMKGIYGDKNVYKLSIRNTGASELRF